MSRDWPLFEIFIRSKAGLAHKHVGSLHAADAQMALENARDVYCRRREGASIWVVPAAAILASQAEDKAAFFETMEDKEYRHAAYYSVPDGVENM